MCGFCGFTGGDYDKNAGTLELMMDKIRHRGPDSAGMYVDEQNRFSCGFRRLSFIDLEEGSQPIYNEDKSIVVFLNGEIYNYKDLRALLLEKEHVFYTNSDTEVLVHLYEEYGTEMFNHLRGMFAIVLFDKNSGNIVGARDFFGIKPFYYSKQGGNILFGSEIKSFLPHPEFIKEVNPQALAHYMTFQYSVMEETFFKGVFKLPAGHFFIYSSATCEFEITKYFTVSFEPTAAPLDEIVRKIDETVLNSIEAHKISDVEVGSFLSSGVDSSFVAACFGGGKTFTVGFDYERYNEINYAKNLSQRCGIPNYDKMITTEEYWDILPTVQYHMDEPLADPSAVALYFVSKLASGYVKAALSGEGADEFFGGYNIYKEPLDLKILTDMPKGLRKVLATAARLIPFHIKGKSFFMRGGKTVEERFIGNANIFSETERSKILKNPQKAASPQEITKKYYDEAKSYDDITKMQYLDINMWMVGDILLKADKMSMANSLEVRVPYLDKKVFALARTLPTEYRTNKTATKYAFRLAAQSHLPEETAFKKKLGFPVPIRVWLRDDKYYNIVKKAFTSDAAKLYFNENELIKLLDKHKKGRRDFSRKIWTVYTFLIWYEKFFA